jgi:hypothetical protein
VRWREDAHNALYDEGEFGILDICFRGGAAPTTWYIGILFNTLSSAPPETATLADIPVNTREPDNVSCPGYSSRGAILRDSSSNGWPTLVLSGGDYQITSKTVSWTALGNWSTPIRWMFLTTEGTPRNSTGKLFSLAQLSADRTVLSGDTLNITYNLKLQ